MAEPGAPDRLSPEQPQVSRGYPPPVVGAPHLTRGFLFADLRDYTSYVEARGDHAGAELLARYRAVVRGAVAASNGAEIKTEGDSFYVVFDSASAAVRCGQEILAAADAAPGDPIRIGVGVHAGETVETEEGYVGSAVNIAARLCSQARAGELVVSDTVRALTRTYLDVDFEPLGARRLKGVNEQIALYRVVPHAGTVRVRAPRAGGRRGPWLALGIGGIVVVALAVAGIAVVGGAGGSPTTSPGSSAQATPSAAPASGDASAGPSASPTASSVWTLAEQELLARIPRELQPFCRRSSKQQGALGGSAMLQCDLPVDSEPLYAADTVWYDAFDAPGLMAAEVSRVSDRYGLAEGTCSAETTGVIGTWEIGLSYSGLQACYLKDGGAWMLWTYKGDNIAARAVRRDGDVSTLFTWWKDYGSILRG